MTFDPIQSARDLYGILLSSWQLNNVNIAFYRELRIKSQVDFNKIVTTKRNGFSGAGVVVLEPWAKGQQRNVLCYDWIFPIVSIECPQINERQMGTGLSVYQLAMIVGDILHNYADMNIGTFYIDSTAIEDEPHFKLEGCIEKRTNLHILGKNGQTPRVGQITNSISTNIMTLNCAQTPSAAIYYTLDGSAPVSEGNSNARLYNSPFPVASGQAVRAIGYLNGSNNSAAMYQSVP